MTRYRISAQLTDSTDIDFTCAPSVEVEHRVEGEAIYIRTPEMLAGLESCSVRALSITPDGGPTLDIVDTVPVRFLRATAFDAMLASAKAEPMVRARSFNLPSHRVALAPDDNFVGLDPGVGDERPALIYTSRSPDPVDDFTPGRQIYELTPIGGALSPEAQTIEAVRIPALGGVAVLSRLQ